MSKITIESNDKNFLVRLVEWLNSQECELDSTVIKLHDELPAIGYNRWDCDKCNWEGSTPCPDHSNFYPFFRSLRK